MALDQVDVDKMNSADQEMSFLDHLEELRWHLIRGFGSIIFFAIFTFIAKDFIFNEIIMAHKDKDFFTYRLVCGFSEALCFFPEYFNVETRTLEEKFLTHVKVSIILAFIMSFPYLLWELWRFIKPGLYDSEKKAARGMVFVCSFLFLSGIMFGYYVIAPFAITFLSGYNIGDVETTPILSAYVNLITMLTIPTGFVFELPIVVYFLSKIGLVTPEFMKQYRKHAFIIILILAAIITPPDIITQFLIGIPLYVLYELSISISARVIKNQEKEESTEIAKK